MMKRQLMCCCAIAILLTGCAMPGFAASPGPSGPQAWIDQPLDGSALPLAPVAIVAHASDLAGLDQLEFTINGTIIGADSGGGPTQSFVAYHHSWSPESAGIYTLRVRARNAGGAWGGYASATFRVGVESSNVTLTPEPVRTVAPAGTLTPTATATAPGISFTLVQVTPGIFHHSKGCGPNDPNCQSSCRPNQINIRAQVTPPERVGSLVLFFALADKKSSTAWNDGVSMHALGNGLYEYNLPADKVPNAKSFDEATFKYQFVATDSNKNVLARSQVFNDVTLSACP